MHYRMTTNGLLLDEEKLAFCRDNRIIFALSIDGDERSHDLNRVGKDGKGSFKRLESIIPLIFKYHPHVVAQAVITRNTAPHLCDSLKYLIGAGFTAIILTFDHFDQWTPRDIRVLKAQYKEAAEFYYSCLDEGTDLYVSLFDEKFVTHAEGPYKRGTVCDIGRSQVSIAPNGELYPCVKFVNAENSASMRLGSVFNGFDEVTRKRVMKESLAPRPQCHGCEFEGRCSNYCGCTNWRLTGSLNTVAPIICEHERMLIPIADSIGERLYRDRNPLFIKKLYGKGIPKTAAI